MSKWSQYSEGNNAIFSLQLEKALFIVLACCSLFSTGCCYDNIRESYPKYSIESSSSGNTSLHSDLVRIDGDKAVLFQSTSTDASPSIITRRIYVGQCQSVPKQLIVFLTSKESEDEYMLISDEARVVYVALRVSNVNNDLQRLVELNAEESIAVCQKYNYIWHTKPIASEILKRWREE